MQRRSGLHGGCLQAQRSSRSVSMLGPRPYNPWLRATQRPSVFALSRRRRLHCPLTRRRALRARALSVMRRFRDRRVLRDQSARQASSSQTGSARKPRLGHVQTCRYALATHAPSKRGAPALSHLVSKPISWARSFSVSVMAECSCCGVSEVRRITSGCGRLTT